MSENTFTGSTTWGFASTSTNFTSDWLNPVDALTRFAPNERIMLEADDARESVDTRYGVRIGDIGLLIGARVPCEFILPVPVSRIPNTPDWFTGLINLRGALVPVFDLSLLIGVDESAGEQAESPTAGRTLFLVLDRGESAGALRIRGFPQALTALKPLEDTPPAPAPLDECVGNVFISDGVTWLEFEHRELFAALSRRMERYLG